MHALWPIGWSDQSMIMVLMLILMKIKGESESELKYKSESLPLALWPMRQRAPIPSVWELKNIIFLHLSPHFFKQQDDLASKGKTWQEGQLQQWARRGLEGEASGGAPPGDHDNGEMHYDDRQCGELHDDDGELHDDWQCGELMCYRKWESSLLTSTQAAHLKKDNRHYRHYLNSHHSVVAPSSSE